MKKPIKIFLIIIPLIIALISVYLYVIRLTWHGLSVEDKLTVLKSMYKKCQMQNDKNCELKIADRLNDVIGAQKIELVRIIQDMSKPEENRIFALSMFFGLSRGDNQLITVQESDFYYSLATEDKNPFGLRQLACSYLLDAQIDDEKIIALKKQMIASPDVHSDFKIKALKNLTITNVNDLEGILLADLANPDSGVRLEVANVLGRMAEPKQIPGLMAIALDETNDLTGRSLALLALEDIFRKNNINNSGELVADLESLLSCDECTIRLAAANALESLTGESQNVEATQAQVDDYISNTFLSDY